MGKNMDVLDFTKQQIACIRVSQQLLLRSYKKYQAKSILHNNKIFMHLRQKLTTKQEN